MHHAPAIHSPNLSRLQIGDRWQFPMVKSKNTWKRQRRLGRPPDALSNVTQSFFAGIDVLTCSLGLPITEPRIENGGS
jgi:hypothetical protein